MQPFSKPRPIGPTCIRKSLTVFALTLALLALAIPLGASAADEKDELRRDTPQREETPAAVVVEAREAPAPQDQLQIETAHPVCPPGFELAQPPLNPDLGCVATDLAYENPAPSPDPEPVCPEGFEPAEPPLNPALGCLASNGTGGSGGSSVPPPDPPCPEGFVPALPPLNPELGCIASAVAIAVDDEPETATFVGVDESRHPGHDDCPPGWVPARSPLNEDLGCINNTEAAGVVAGDATGGSHDPGSWATGGSQHHPGHCQEGYVLKLLLRQNPDGSLTFFYGCVKDGGVTGPDDITSGATEPVVAYVAWTGPDVLTVPPCPEGSARHPYYPEYGCIPYGSGPWAL